MRTKSSVTRGRTVQRCSWVAAGRAEGRPPTGHGCSRSASTSDESIRTRFGGNSEPERATSPRSCPRSVTGSPTFRAHRSRLGRRPLPAIRLDRLVHQERRAQNPWVLVLDDLHAADEPSLLLLRFLARELDGSRVLVVGTYRDVDPTVRDPLASTLSELARQRVTGRVHLGGLTQADVERYIELETGPRRQPTSLPRSRTRPRETRCSSARSCDFFRGRRPRARRQQALSTLGVPQGVRGSDRPQAEEPVRRKRSRAHARVGRRARVPGGRSRATVRAVGRVLLELLDEAVAARLVTSVPEA